jgi:hypothetical protein
MKLPGGLRLASTAFLLVFGAACAWAGDDFPPVKPVELAMKKDASNPSNAEILYHESILNNREHSTTEYYRIKIFTDAAKKYADIEIRYDRDFFRLSDLKARTVLSDGTIVPFDGKVFDKVVAKRHGFDVRATGFALPNVQAGCILEYRYRLTWSSGYFLIPPWIVQEELPMLQAHYLLNIPPGVIVAPVSSLPSNAEYSRPDPGTLELTVSNVAPFEAEDYSLTAEALKWHVRFYQLPSRSTTEDDFWKEVGKAWYKFESDFTQGRKGVTEEVARLVQPSDPPEAKLRKLYARAQQLRNLTFARGRTEAEAKREVLKVPKNAEQVLEHGYGYRTQINEAFLALARAAGFETAMVWVSERYEMPFDPRVMDTFQVPWALVVVKLGGEERFFDPGTPGCPFGLIPGEDIKVQGLRPTPDGIQFVTTPLPSAEASQRLRRGEFTLAEDGSLHGRLSLTYTGLFALDQRLGALEQDEAGRRKQIEDSIRGWLPSQTQVKLEKVSGWEDAAQPLQVEATVDVPSVTVPSGRRIILPADIFEVNHKNPFAPAARKSDIYLSFPNLATDDLTLHLPTGYLVEALTPSQEFGGGTRLHYQVSRTQAGSDVHIQRQSRLNDVFFESSFYPALRQFYSRMGDSDEEPIVLRAGAPAN